MTDKTTPAMRPSGAAQATVFDRFAGRAARLVSRAPFFAACVLLVIVWLPTTVLMDFNTSQLLINTPTTIITFLLVAMLQNTQTRNEQAVQRKLNAIADGLADLMEELSDDRPGLHEDLWELEQAVGLEHREGTGPSPANESAPWADDGSLGGQGQRAASS